MGFTTLSLEPAGCPVHDAQHRLALPAVPEALAGLALAPPLQLLAYHLFRATGLDPDSRTHLNWVERPVRLLNTDIAVILRMTQIHLPFMVLPLVAVLSARDRTLELASLNLGASHWQTFWRIILPQSIPGISAGMALVFAISYTNFIVPQLLGGGGYTTLAVQVYEFIVVILDWTKGAVLASLLLGSCFLFVLGITILGNRLSRWREVTG